MLPEALQRHPLHIGAQAGAHRSRLAAVRHPLQPLACKVGRLAFAGRPAPLLQDLADLPFQHLTADRLDGVLALIRTWVLAVFLAWAAGERLRLQHVAPYPAGTLGHALGAGIGRAHQGSGNGCFLHVQPVRGLAEQAARQRIDAHDLAAKRHQVQVGLQNLVLAPAAFQPLRGHGLAQLLGHAATAAALAPVLVQQTGKLHGDGAGPARAAVPQIAPSSGRDSSPVHTAVGIETLVFTQHQGHAQCGRDVGQRRPVSAPGRAVGAQALQRLAFAREDPGLRRAKVRAHLGVAGQGPGVAGQAAGQAQPGRARKQTPGQKGQRQRSTHNS